MRRRALSLVVFNLLLALFTSTTTATAETKPSCAACLDTSRAVDRALSKTRGDSSPMMSMGEDSQQQQRRGRSFPAFASEPEVAAALAEQTCNEVRFPGFSSRFLLSLLFALYFFWAKEALLQEPKQKKSNKRKEQVPRRHRQSCGSLLAAHSARLADFFLNASPSSSPSSPSSPSHRRQQQQRLPSCTEELCVVLSGACRPHEVSGEL
jgi:hypothetical protein